jgi:hypothetical protein
VSLRRARTCKAALGFAKGANGKEGFMMAEIGNDDVIATPPC